MRNLLLLAMLPFLFSCKDTLPEAQAAVAVDPGEVLHHLQGRYNAEEDAWENPHDGYSSYCSFDGTEYATFSKLDGERNSIGLGLIDKTGKVIVQPIYNGISVGFHNGLCEVTNSEGKRGCVNKDGIEIIKTEYDYVNIYDETSAIGSNMIQVSKNDKYGFVNKEGKVIVELKYNFVQPAGKNRLMFMTEPAHWGIMDYAGNVICKPIFTHTNIFENGKMTLQKADGENYTVFEDGKIVKQ